MTSAPLGQLAEIRGGGTPRRDIPAYWNGKIPWATVKDFKTTEIAHTLESISELGVKESATNVIPAGNIIIPTRMALGKVAINRIDLAINQDLKALLIHDRKRVDGEYLFRFLLSKSAYIEGQGKGATVKGITLDVLRDMDVPLPPLAEQRRIATILDKADAIRRKRQQATLLADEFLRSVFLNMFGDPRTNPKGLDQEPLGNLIKLRSGDFLSAAQMNLSGTHLVYGGNGISGRHDHFMFKDPQIVIGRVGVYCGAIHLTEPFSWVTDNALYVSEMGNSLVGKYLEWALRMAKLNQYANQAAQPLISGGRIYPIEILVPDKKNQERFEQIAEKFTATRARLTHLNDMGENLFGSVSQRAFRGEL